MRGGEHIVSQLPEGPTDVPRQTMQVCLRERKRERDRGRSGML